MGNVSTYACLLGVLLIFTNSDARADDTMRIIVSPKVRDAATAAMNMCEFESTRGQSCNVVRLGNNRTVDLIVSGDAVPHGSLSFTLPALANSAGAGNSISLIDRIQREAVESVFNNTSLSASNAIEAPMSIEILPNATMQAFTSDQFANFGIGVRTPTGVETPAYDSYFGNRSTTDSIIESLMGKKSKINQYWSYDNQFSDIRVITPNKDRRAYGEFGQRWLDGTRLDETLTDLGRVDFDSDWLVTYGNLGVVDEMIDPDRWVSSYDRGSALQLRPEDCSACITVEGSPIHFLGEPMKIGGSDMKMLSGSIPLPGGIEPPSRRRYSLYSSVEGCENIDYGEGIEWEPTDVTPLIVLLLNQPRPIIEASGSYCESPTARHGTGMLFLDRSSGRAKIITALHVLQNVFMSGPNNGLFFELREGRRTGRMKPFKDMNIGDTFDCDLVAANNNDKRLHERFFGIYGWGLLDGPIFRNSKMNVKNLKYTVSGCTSFTIVGKDTVEIGVKTVNGELAEPLPPVDFLRPDNGDLLNQNIFSFGFPRVRKLSEVCGGNVVSNDLYCTATLSANYIDPPHSGYRCMTLSSLGGISGSPIFSLDRDGFKVLGVTAAAVSSKPHSTGDELAECKDGILAEVSPDGRRNNIFSTFLQ